MKKYSFLVAAALLFSCTFCSCGDDEEEEEEQKPNPQNQVDDQTGKVIDNGGDVNNTPSDDNGGTTTPSDDNGGSTDVKLFDKRITSIAFTALNYLDEGVATSIYTYDSNGQIAKMENNQDGTFEYVYSDNEIKVINTYENDDNAIVTETNVFKYANGFLTSVDYTDEDGVTTTQTLTDLKVDGNTITFTDNDILEDDDEDIPYKGNYTIVLDNNCIKSIKVVQVEPEMGDNFESYEFEYGDIENEYAVDIFTLLMADMFPSFTTIRNKYLPSKMTIHSKNSQRDDTSIYTFTYEKDTEGYVTKITIKSTSKMIYLEEGFEDEDDDDFEYVINY